MAMSTCATDGERLVLQTAFWVLLFFIVVISGLVGDHGFEPRLTECTHSPLHYHGSHTVDALSTASRALSSH
jgi:hypothetical protein